MAPESRARPGGGSRGSDNRGTMEKREKIPAIRSAQEREAVPSCERKSRRKKGKEKRGAAAGGGGPASP